MKKTLFFCSIVAFVTAKPGGFFHQEYNYKSSSSSFKNNELQHKNEDQGFYSKDGDLEGRVKPKVNSHSQHSEYTNPKLLSGSSTNIGIGGYNGANVDQANIDRLFSSNMEGYHAGGAADGYASTDRVMDLANVYTSGSHGSSHGSYGSSLGYGSNSAGYGSNTGGFRTNSGGYRTSTGGHIVNSDGYSSNSGYGTNLGGYGRTHENYDASRGGNYGNSLEGSSNFGYSQGGSSYGYVQRGGSSGYRSTNTNLNSMVQRLQEEMSRQLQNAVNNQYRSSGYTTSVSSSQMTADIRTLEDELKRNLTRQLEESLRSQYGQQQLRGTDSYSVVEGRPSTVLNYRNQELADLTGQLENNLLKQLHQNIRTTYNRESGSSYRSSNNVYQPTYVSSSTYRPSHYERPTVVIPSNIRYTPVSNPESITQIASRIQSDINVYLDNALKNIYSTYLQSGRNTYTLTDFDNEVNRIRDQIIRNLTWSLDEQIRRNYGQQILKDDNYYSVSSTGQTSSLHNYNIKDYESLKKQVEENLLNKLNQTVNTYRDQYQRQQSYSTNTNYYTATFRPVYYTSGNQVYDYSDLQRQLSEQLQNALNKHRYSHSSSYSMSTSNNPQAYKMSLDELTRELQRNLTEQLNNYRVQSSSSSYGYTSGASGGGGSADFESMKNQLQNQLLQQLQQGLQKQYRYSASASYSASSSSSSNANYGTHQQYGNYANMYPNNRYKRDINFHDPRDHHFSYNSAKSSRAYSTNSKFSSQEQNRGMNFITRTHDSQPLELGDSMNFGRTSGSYFQSAYSKRYEGFGDSSPNVVEDATNHHQVERPQKLYMTADHSLEIGRPEHNWHQHSKIPEFNHKLHEEKFTDQELSDPIAHYGHSMDQANNEFELSGHKFSPHKQFPGQEQVEEQQHTVNSENHFTQKLQTDDYHKQFKFNQNHQQSQEDLDQKLEFEHPEQIQTTDSQKHFKFTPNYQLPEQSQEDLDQKLEIKHPEQIQTADSQAHFKFTPNHQLPDQQSQEDLDQKLEFNHPDQIQTVNTQKHFKFSPNHQLPEQQPQEELDQKLEFEFPRKPMQSAYLQQPEQHLEDQENLSQKLEQEPQLQQIEDLNSQKLEFDQQIDDQNELPKDLNIIDSQKLMNGLPKLSQEQQQVEAEPLPKQYHGKPFGSSQDKLTRKLDQSEEDLTQQLEFNGSKYPLKTDGEPIEDLPTQQVQLSLNNKPKKLQEQDFSTQQQVQDDLTQQIQLTNARTPKNKTKYTQEQELEQQLETDSINLIASNKLNLQSEQQLVDQEDLTQQLEVEGKQKTVELSSSDLSQQLELAKKPEPSEQKLISEQQFEDQDDSEPNLSTGPQRKHNYDQSQVEQSEEDMTQQLIMSNKPNSKNTQEQELAGQEKADLDQQLEIDDTQNQQKVFNTPYVRTNQEVQEPDNTQQLESEPSLEPVEGNLEQKHQDQSENDSIQHLEPIDFHKPNKLKHFQEDIENDLEQKLELSHSQKPNQLDQQVQQQQHLDTTPKDITHIQNKQTEEQQLEDDLTQQLESENIRINRKPNKSPNFGQELENDQDQQLELREEHKSRENDSTEEQQQTQLQLTETDQTESKLNQQILTELPEIDNNLELTYAKPKNENPDQKQLTDQIKDKTQHEISDGYFPQHSWKNGYSGDNLAPQQQSSTSHKISTHQINQDLNPTIVTYQRPESHTYLHSSSDDRSFTNGHTGYSTSKATGHNYEEALRQQDALLDLLKQKIHGQPDNQSTNDRTIIKKTAYLNESPIGSSDQTHVIKTNEETIRNGGPSPAQTGSYGKSHQDISHKIERYDENGIRRTTYPVHVNNPFVQGTQTIRTSRRVYHFVNGKPVSATDYVRIVKPNGQIIENKYEMPLIPDLPIRQNEFSLGHTMGNTQNIPSTDNFLRQYELSHGKPSRYSIDTASSGTKTGHYDGIHSTEDFLRQNQFSHGLPSSQFSQNMENQFQVDGSRTTNNFGQIVESKHNLPTMNDLLRQNQYSHNINDPIGGLGLTSNNFRQTVNGFNHALGTSGFTGQASKKTSYYVNGKLVSSSESNQLIEPNGRITEINRGSNPSAVGKIEQQIADLQGSYTGHKSENKSRYSVKTSRHTRRIGY